MRRFRVKSSKDRKVFHNSASTTKAINLYPHIMRGGIRM